MVQQQGRVSWIGWGRTTWSACGHVTLIVTTAPASSGPKGRSRRARIIPNDRTTLDMEAKTNPHGVSGFEPRYFDAICSDVCQHPQGNGADPDQRWRPSSLDCLHQKSFRAVVLLVRQQTNWLHSHNSLATPVDLGRSTHGVRRCYDLFEVDNSGLTPGAYSVGQSGSCKLRRLTDQFGGQPFRILLPEADHAARLMADVS